MNEMRKYLGILLMAALFIGVASCQDDEEIFDRIVGRTWVGDLGFTSHDIYADPLESAVYLGSDGFGEDELYYYNGGYYETLRIQWSVNNNSLYINYGNVAAPREIRNMYVSGRQISGSLYINGVYWNEVDLQMH